MRNVDPQEWEARCDLAAAYRLIAHFGMDDLIFTHLSMRIPGEGHRFLLNPYGYLFDEITASSLVAVDPDGHAIESEEESKINNAGFTIHSAVHMSRDDAHCVMHTHTTAGMAVAAQEQGCCRSTRCRWSSTTASPTTTTRASRSTSTSASGWCTTSATERQ